MDHIFWKRSLFLLLSCGFLAVCTAVFPAPAEVPVLEPTAEEPRLPVAVSAFGSLVHYDPEDLVSKSELVAVGTVTAQSEGFLVGTASGEGGIVCTDYTFRLDNVWKGAPTSRSVTVRVRGGVTEKVTFTMDTEPRLVQGEQFLLFLYKPQMGGAYTTGGDYYYVTGAMQGAFHSAEQGYENRLGTVLTEEMFAQVRHSAETGTSDPREVYLQNLKDQLEAGYLTPEGYEQLVAQADSYAVMIEE